MKISAHPWVIIATCCDVILIVFSPWRQTLHGGHAFWKLADLTLLTLNPRMTRDQTYAPLCDVSACLFLLRHDGES